MKVIGIDYGEARVGVSFSDDLGMFAHPLETIHVKKIDPIKRIIEIAGEKKIDLILKRDSSVIFLPHLNISDEVLSRLNARTKDARIEVEINKPTVE